MITSYYRTNFRTYKAPFGVPGLLVVGKAVRTYEEVSTDKSTPLQLTPSHGCRTVQNAQRRVLAQ